MVEKKMFDLFANQVTAKYLGGLTWQCPFCKRQNIHNFSDLHNRNMTSIIGTKKRCNGCKCNYILGTK